MYGYRPSIKYGRNLEFVLCLDHFGQSFELLLLSQFTMDLSEIYIDETMGIAPQSNTAEIWNLYCYSATQSYSRHSC